LCNRGETRETVRTYVGALGSIRTNFPGGFITVTYLEGLTTPFSTVCEVQRRVQTYVDRSYEVEVQGVLDSSVDTRTEVARGIRTHGGVGSVIDEELNFGEAVVDAHIVTGAVAQFTTHTGYVGHVNDVAAKYRGVTARVPLQEGEAVRVVADGVQYVKSRTCCRIYAARNGWAVAATVRSSVQDQVVVAACEQTTAVFSRTVEEVQ